MAKSKTPFKVGEKIALIYGGKERYVDILQVAKITEKSIFTTVIETTSPYIELGRTDEFPIPSIHKTAFECIFNFADSAVVKNINENNMEKGHKLVTAIQFRRSNYDFRDVLFEFF